MRRSKAPFDDWLNREAASEDDPRSSDLCDATFRLLPPAVQERVRRRLLDDCLRVLAATDGLWGGVCARSFRASGDERHALEYMCDMLLTTTGLDVH